MQFHRFTRFLPIIAILAILTPKSLCRTELPVIELKLDTPLEEMYGEVVTVFKDNCVKAYNDIMKQYSFIVPYLKAVAEIRGPEDARLQAETEYFAKAAGLPVEGVKLI